MHQQHLWVATVLTVYGIETCRNTYKGDRWVFESQQYLPFTVLKHRAVELLNKEVTGRNSTYRLRYWNLRTSNTPSADWTVATVLTVYGIETRKHKSFERHTLVATVLTVYGIETPRNLLRGIFIPHRSQQYLPFTVLKLVYLWTI